MNDKIINVKITKKLNIFLFFCLEKMNMYSSFENNLILTDTVVNSFISYTFETLYVFRRKSRRHNWREPPTVPFEENIIPLHWCNYYKKYFNNGYFPKYYKEIVEIFITEDNLRIIINHLFLYFSKTKYNLFKKYLVKFIKGYAKSPLPIINDNETFYKSLANFMQSEQNTQIYHQYFIHFPQYRNYAKQICDGTFRFMHFNEETYDNYEHNSTNAVLANKYIALNVCKYLY